jgi:hypothetical protein
LCLFLGCDVLDPWGAGSRRWLGSLGPFFGLEPVWGKGLVGQGVAVVACVRAPLVSHHPAAAFLSGCGWYA